MKDFSIFLFVCVFIWRVDSYDGLGAIKDTVNGGLQELETSGSKFFEGTKKKFNETLQELPKTAKKEVDKLIKSGENKAGEFAGNAINSLGIQSVNPGAPELANPNHAQPSSIPNDENRGNYHRKPPSSESEEKSFESRETDIRPKTEKLRTPAENPTESKGLGNHSLSFLIIFPLFLWQ